MAFLNKRKKKYVREKQRDFYENGREAGGLERETEAVKTCREFRKSGSIVSERVFKKREK